MVISQGPDISSGSPAAGALSRNPASNHDFEPVAIIGMGCRWPGDCNQPSDLWSLLQEKKDAYGEFPKERINVDAFYHEKRDRPGSFYTRGGCFLQSDTREFDHTFFGINPQEATSIDPAQRKLLETVYEAFESAGVPLEKVSGSRTGCFVGNFNYDHQLMQYRDAEYPEPYAITGGGITILSNRITYTFNLSGPSLTIDTACSSSMYALHLACSALHAGDCTGAIVAGSNLILTPECQIFSSNLGAVSPSSRCHTFDAAADGYARADGIGALYIKKLADAVKDNDPIRAVIRGTAVNSNGKTGGISHPSPIGQELAIRRAYQRAGLDPDFTDYVECHGTGTAYGDPLEVAAIGEIFTLGRSESNPLLVGSVKTNLGHSEPASGIAGIMKAVLALEHKSIPPVVGFNQLNPNVDLKDGRIKIVTETTPWPAKESARRASVNSFGYGGANAHTILEAAESFIPQYQPKAERLTDHQKIRTYRDQIEAQINGNGSLAVDWRSHDETSDHEDHPNIATANGYSIFNDRTITNGDEGVVAPILNGQDLFSESAATKSEAPQNEPPSAIGRSQFLLVFSAHNARTLESNIEATRSVKGWKTLDLAYTLGQRRSTFRHRAFALSQKPELDVGIIPQNVPLHKVETSQLPKLCFVMTGQGAQWVNMGLDLMSAFTVYSRTIKELDRYLQDLENKPTWTIEGAIRTSAINNAEISQPVTTATQIALVNLLRSWNIHPSVAIGHSSGEMAAAYAAGILTARNAIVIAYLRGVAVNHNHNDGSMLAVGITEDDLAKALERKHLDVEIACYNGPENLTISGDSGEIMAVKEELEDQKKFVRKLATDGNAYHSNHMKSVGPEYEREIIHSHAEASSTRVIKTVPFISTVTTEELKKAPLGAHYWRTNLESPVLFHQAIDNIVHNYDVNVLIEIGPHNALRSALKQIAKAIPGVQFPDYIPTLIKESNGVSDLLNTAGSLFTKGYPVDFLQINSVVTEKKYGDSVDHGRIIVDLPRYQWQYDKPLFKENRWTREWRLRSHARHDLLGSRVPGGTDNQPMWRNVIRLKDVAWLSDHCIGSDVVFPAAGYVSMALEAVTQAFETKGGDVHSIETYDVNHIVIKAALLLPVSEDGVEVLLTLRIPEGVDWKSPRGGFEFVITSTTDLGQKHDFIEHARGSITIAMSDVGPSPRLLSMHSDVRHAAQKPLSKSRWYNTFSKTGLVYGPAFQSITGLTSCESQTVAAASITVGDAQSPTLAGESRYVIHPTKLDAVLQTSIIAATSGMLSRLKTGYVPTGVERMTFWPKKLRHSNSLCSTTAKMTTSQPRTFSADAVILTDHNKAVFEGIGLHFSAIGNIDNHSISNGEPYSRLEWKPDFGCLTTKNVATLFPVMHADISSKLSELAVKQIIQFHTTYKEFFDNGSSIPHLQKFLDWMKSKVDATGHELQSPPDTATGNVDRVADISNLSATLRPLSSECRIMCHMYEQLPAIFRGEMTGIQAALQHNLLNDLYEKGQLLSEGNRRLGSVIELLSHQNPALRILEIGAGTGSASREVLRALKGDTSHRRYTEYVYTDVTTSFLGHAEQKFSNYTGVTYATFDMEKPGAEQGYEAVHDLVLASNAVHATSNIIETLRNIRAVLKPGGKLILLEITQSSTSAGLILGTFSDFWKAGSDPSFPRYEGPFLSKAMWRNILPQAGFSGLDFFLDDFTDQPSSSVLVASAVSALPETRIMPVLSHESLTLVHAETPSPFVHACRDYLTAKGLQVYNESLSSPGARRSGRYIVLVETEVPLFNRITQMEWNGLQTIIRNAKSLIWVTNGSLLDGDQPLFAIIEGILRGLKTERQQTRFATIDLDPGDQPATDSRLDLIYQLHKRISDESSRFDDWAFRQKAGVTYISRLVADEKLNNVTKAKSQRILSTNTIALSDIKDTRLELRSDKTGLYFSKGIDHLSPIEAGVVEIDVKAFHLPESQNVEISHSVFGFSGIVKNVGEAVKEISPDDRVYGVSFSNPGSILRVDASCCRPMDDAWVFQDISTVPATFCEAYYALVTLAQLDSAETVLIQASANSSWISAMQLTRCRGAEVYISVSSSSRKQAVLDFDPTLEEDHILISDEYASSRDILNRTAGKGVDVILSYESGESTLDFSSCLAKFGRLVHVGRQHAIHTDQLMKNLSKSHASFFAVDFESIMSEKPKILTDTMERVQGMLLGGQIKPLPYSTTDASQLDDVSGSVDDGLNSRGRVIALENEESMIKVRDSKFDCELKPDASYLLVGCLGGLGRQVANLLIDRGAKHLTFLSRSGDQSQAVQAFLGRITDRGVTARIAKGDVTSLEDVKRAIALSEKPVRGVLQAALTLKDRLFENMSLEDFNTTVKPRVEGTLNLHTALIDTPLDFFVTWSSWTSIFGVPAQTNYLASNAFMDAFACHRRSLGLPATSLSLSQIMDVGIVSGIPEYQASLDRNGLYGSGEDEFLEFCDTAFTPGNGAKNSKSDRTTYGLDEQTLHGQLLAGIEPKGMRELGKSHPLSEMPWYSDPRFTTLRSAVDLLESGASGRNKAIKDADDGDDATAAEKLHRKVAKLLYTSQEEIDIASPIKNYGIDSMIAAELRNWLFTTFKLDVSLLTLLGPTTSIEVIVGMIEEKAE